MPHVDPDDPIRLLLKAINALHKEADKLRSSYQSAEEKQQRIIDRKLARIQRAINDLRDDIYKLRKASR